MATTNEENEEDTNNVPTYRKKVKTVQTSDRITKSNKGQENTQYSLAPSPQVSISRHPLGQPHVLSTGLRPVTANKNNIESIESKQPAPFSNKQPRKLNFGMQAYFSTQLDKKKKEIEPPQYG